MVRTLTKYVRGWEGAYRQNAAQVRLFDTKRTAIWTPEQRQRFVRLFYHARGHFVSDFLWHLANRLPPAYRAVVIDNIIEELGGGPGEDPHECLFASFAKELEVDILEETRTDRSYLPFLRMFNAGHSEWILSHDLAHNWAAFAAYELLDNVDYVNLLALAKSVGVTAPEGLLFFRVHMEGDHYHLTQNLLEGLWTDNPEAVREGFEFIASHQLKMWKGISEEIYA